MTCIAENFHADKEIFKYLLEKNMGLRFGKFAFEDDGKVWFEYSMFGENLNRKNFVTILQSIIRNASQYKKDIRIKESNSITSNWLSDDAAEWLESHRGTRK